jgi:hypothetical protein
MERWTERKTEMQTEMQRRKYAWSGLTLCSKKKGGKNNRLDGRAGTESEKIMINR